MNKLEALLSQLNDTPENRKLRDDARDYYNKILAIRTRISTDSREGNMERLRSNIPLALSYAILAHGDEMPGATATGCLLLGYILRTHLDVQKRVSEFSVNMQEAKA